MPAGVNSWLMPDAADPVREIAELRALLAEREAELAEARAELTGARLRIEQYKVQLAQLRRMQFGRFSEKLDTQIEQLELMLEDLEESEAARTSPAAPRVPDQPRRERPSTASIKRPVLVPVSAHGSAKDRNCASASTMRLTMPNRSKVLRASRSIRVTVTTSPGASLPSIRLSSRRSARAPVTFSR